MQEKETHDGFVPGSVAGADDSIKNHYVTEEEAIADGRDVSGQGDLRQELREQARTNVEQETKNDDKSIMFGVIGWGQGGSRIAEEFAKYGYPVCVGNTARQDLEHIRLPENRKLFVDYALGGVGKDINLGEEAFLENQDQIIKLLEDTFQDNVDQIIVAVGGGGGTGSGAAVPLAKLVSQFGLPVIVLYTLPMYNEGATTKYNSVKVLDRLSHLVVSGEISALGIIDNSRIELVYPNVSTGSFWRLANFDIVNGLHIFNALSASSTKHTSLDPMDFARILSTGNCITYGKMEVPVTVENGKVVMREDELAAAVINNMNDSLLAEGFDLTETERAGVIIVGKEEILDQIPAVTMNYAFAMLTEATKGAGLFRGVYADEMAGNKLTVYTLYAGLGIPRARIDNLISDAEEEHQSIEAKIGNKKEKMSVLEKPQLKQVDGYRKLAEKNTSFGRMVSRRKNRG